MPTTINSYDIVVVFFLPFGDDMLERCLHRQRSVYLSCDIMVQITHSSKDYNQQHATYFTASTIKPKVSVRKLRHIVAIETDNFVTINHWDQKQSRLDNFSKTHKKIIVFKTNGFYERKVSNQETKHTVHG